MTYTVKLAGTDLAFAVEADETVLAAALRSGVSLPHDCQLGGCGTCRVRLLDGAVTYDEWPFALTEEEAASGYALMCQSRPAADLVIEPPAVASLPQPERRTAIVRSVRALSPTVTHLVLDVPEIGPSSFRPGQYMNVMLPEGARSFSMASAPGDGVVDFHIRRQPGGRFTDHGLSQLSAGDQLEIEMPHGAFYLRLEDDRPLLMVATGTGLAPMKAMLESLADHPDCPPVSLYWGARTAGDLYLHDAVGTWGAGLDDFRYVPVLSRGDDHWTGRRGYVQHAALTDYPDLSGHAIYLCGSPPMIAEAKSRFMACGAMAEFMYAEGFMAQQQPQAVA
ncbi:MAG: 2Fe-2S iron-sulfur cluster-binding protein [Pseudolabrys sp.]